MKYPKELVLKDGEEAIIRPLENQDEQLLRQFYTDIPEDDRWFMKYDVMDPVVIRKWLDAVGTDRVFSTVALHEGAIIAHAALFVQSFGCTKHIGRLRIIVMPEFRHKRLGSWMLLNLIRFAMEKGLEELRADFVIGKEDVAIEGAQKLDFFKKAVLEDYVIDPQGKRYDLMIMVKRLHKDWGDF